HKRCERYARVIPERSIACSSRWFRHTRPIVFLWRRMLLPDRFPCYCGFFNLKKYLSLGRDMLKRIIAATTVLSALMLGVLLFTTTPSSTGPLGILGFFVFMYLTALGVLTFLFWSMNIFISK